MSKGFLYFAFPEDAEINIDGIIMTKNEFLEEVVETLEKIHERIFTRETRATYEFYKEFIYTDKESYPISIVLQYPTDMVEDDYILEYLISNARVSFIENEKTREVEYKSMEGIDEAQIQQMYIYCKYFIGDLTSSIGY